ncbi:GNAT family N-acetyltransferase [Occultella glacieicola]|uniref:GNAT family N-acetyltransferase n=1 Tax=Occultella glacieicola TaxID=2518684 RepID=A0ABY2E0K1_9MICO|nr:GNAT family N-acetyltransferase [Occultella glacieicola]TDE90830.1 GNAT family N-acetyltransferase [Occultella glacieicola]
MRVVRIDPADPAALARVHAIRFEVFVGEQGVRADEELDDLDARPGTSHVLVTDDPDDATGAADLGTARLLADPAHPGTVHVTRVAVRGRARRRGVGGVLMVALEEIALAEHAAGEPATVRVELSAQEGALPFYAALGYAIGTDRYLDARIWHRDAVKVLTAR